MLDILKLRQSELEAFQQTYNSVDDENFVNILYERFLGRKASPMDLSNWIRTPALPRETIIAGIVSSDEHKSTRNYVETLKTAASNLIETKKWVEALEVFEELRINQPGSSEWPAQAGHCSSELGKLNEAINYYAAAYELNPQNADIGTELTKLLFGSGREKDAFMLLMNLLSFSPKHCGLLALIATIYAFIDHAQEGVAFFSKINVHTPEWDEAAKQALRWLEKTVQHRGMGIKSRLIAALNEAEDEIRTKLTSYYTGIMTSDEEMAKLRSHLESNPQDFRAWENLGFSYFLTNDPQAGEKCYRQALAITKDSEDTYVGLCYILKRINQFDELKWIAQRLLEINPNSSTGHEMIELANDKLGLERNHRLETETLTERLKLFERLAEDESKPRYLENNRILDEEMKIAKTYVRSMPSYFNIEITGSCNLNPPCVFCFNKDAGSVSYNKLDISLVDRYSYVLERSQGVNDCSFGEPMSHPEFVALVNKMRGSVQHFMFTTNAVLLTGQRAEALAQSGKAVSFSVSLNAALPDTYYKLMGKDLNKTLDNITAYRKRVFELHGVYPTIISNLLLMKINKNEVLDFVKLSKDVGFTSIGLKRLFWDNTEFPVRNSFGYEFDYHKEVVDIEESNEIGLAAKKLGTELGIPVQLNWRADDGYFTTLGSERCGVLCPFPWNFLFAVEHNQMTVPCCYNDGSLGSLAGQSVQEIWNGEIVTTMRRELAAGKVPAHCVKNHHGCPLLAKKETKQ